MINIRCKKYIFAFVMRFLILFLGTLLYSLVLHAQEDRLELVSSSHSAIRPGLNQMMNYVPVYSHKGNTLSADSGYIYTDDLKREYFEAFGHVRITQPNGSIIYADKLHYTAETQLAVLTGNVRMVDGNSVLTTNYLTYNMRNGIGTYTGGGRIVNVTDTITSRNAWYFDRTKDAYFRHNVVVRTSDVKIYTDTMRYNSELKETYFYGPTNIKGNSGENFYTEEGQYNTETEFAKFWKNNLYTEGSRFLKGDSILFDSKTGKGRAVENVVFIDTADQFFGEGGIGLYDRENESIMLTDRPLITTVTKSEKASADTTLGAPVAPLDSAAIDRRRHDNEDIIDTTLTEKRDTALLGLDSLSQDSLDRILFARDSIPKDTTTTVVDSVYLTADTLYSQLIFLRDYKPMLFHLDREGGEILEDISENFEDNSGGDFGGGDFPIEGVPPPVGELRDTSVVDSISGFVDSLYKVPPDSLVNLKDNVAQTDSVVRAMEAKRAIDSIDLKNQELLKQAQRITDSGKKILKRAEIVPLTAGRDLLQRNFSADSVLRMQAPIPKGGEADSLLAEARLSLTKPLEKDSVITDSTKTRIIRAFHNVRMFKSDLQAVADSAYYGYPDSMMRFFGKPMFWARGSQMTADTVYMQIVDEKMDNMVMLSNVMLVNTQLDSTRYNQVKGRKITAFFANNEIDRLFVDGNAESISYNVDEERNIFTEMYHNRSSRIKILMSENQLTDFVPIRTVDGKISPIRLLSQEDEILQGFVWKPGDRPTSKEDLLSRKRQSDTQIQLAPRDSIAAQQNDSIPGSGIAETPIDLNELTELGTDSVSRTLLKSGTPDSLLRRADSLKHDIIPKRDSLERDSLTKDSLQLDSVNHIVPDILEEPVQSRQQAGYPWMLFRKATISATARERWLMAFFSDASISAKVLS